MRRILFALVGTGLLFAGQAQSQTPPPATDPATTAPVAAAPAPVAAATTTPDATTTAAPTAAKPGTTTASTPAPDADMPPPADLPQKPLVPPNWPFTYGVIALVLAVAMYALALITWFIWKSQFSLTDALSEETEDGVLVDAAGAVVKDAAGNPVKKYRLVGSISRVIALLGSVVLIVIYIGFGIFTLFFYASGQGVPTSTKDFLYVLAGGMSLFAPYVVNKFASVFDIFKK
jgi:hypothetical protein